MSALAIWHSLIEDGEGSQRCSCSKPRLHANPRPDEDKSSSSAVLLQPSGILTPLSIQTRISWHRFRQVRVLHFVFPKTKFFGNYGSDKRVASSSA